MTKITINLTENQNKDLIEKLKMFEDKTLCKISKANYILKSLEYTSMIGLEDMLLGRNVDMSDQPIKDQPIEPDKEPHKETFEEFKANSRAEYEEKKKGNWSGLRPHDNDYDFKE